MTEDEYLDFCVYMIISGYNIHDDDDIMDAFVTKDAHNQHYTDEELTDKLKEFLEFHDNY